MLRMLGKNFNKRHFDIFALFFPANRLLDSNLVPLSLFVFICASFVHRWFHVAFILSLFVTHLSFFWCLGGGGLCVMTVLFPGCLLLYIDIPCKLSYLYYTYWLQSSYQGQVVQN